MKPKTAPGPAKKPLFRTEIRKNVTHLICPSGSHTKILSSPFAKDNLLPFFGKPMQ
jgi:hypothetical protein